MKQDKFVLQEKKYIKADKRLDELYKIARQSPKKPLAVPYQRGWELIPVLREDLARSQKGPLIASLIKRFGHINYTRDPNVVRYYRSGCVGPVPRGYIGYGLIDIDKTTYESLLPQEKKYFDTNLSFGSKYNRWKHYIFNLPRHYIVIKVEKYMITHNREVPSEILKEMAELRRFLAEYWRTCRNKYGWDHYFEKRSERRQSKIELKQTEYENI